MSESYWSRGLDPLAPLVSDPLGRQTPTGDLLTFSPEYLGTKYLGFQGLSEAFNSSADSIYHAATISLRRRYAKGLTSTVNYTYGKSIDDASDSGDVRFVNLNVRSPGQVNFGAPRSGDRSVSLFNIKHTFSTSFLYDLPFSRGCSYWSHAPGLVQTLVGNWSLSGVGRIQGGLPMVVFLRDDNRLGVSRNVRAIRPDLVPGISLRNPRWSRNCPIGTLCEPYFNPAAFMHPLKGHISNAPRTFDGARGPTQQFLDLSLQKNFPIGKDNKRRLQLRVDAINLLNHPIFRIGRLEDSGEIFAAPNEGLVTNAEYDTWATLPGTARPARSTPAGAALLTQINQVVISNRIPGTRSLRADFFHVPVPEGFFSMNANSFAISTLQRFQLYRMRQSYTPDRWGFLDVSAGRSGYTPRFMQLALKLYF